MENPPSYDGSGLVNLIAEIERRMTGTSVFPGLTEASVVPDSASYVLVLFDGLGVAGLHHEDAGAFRASYVGSLDAPFPTTTSVSLATVATGLSQHAQVAHLSWYPTWDQRPQVGERLTPATPRNLWDRRRADHSTTRRVSGNR
jgi:hypothetical protein